MSVQVNGVLASPLRTIDSLTTPLKKRKHDDTGKTSSKKKRKHLTAEDQPALLDTSERSVEEEGETKKEKRSKKPKTKLTDDTLAAEPVESVEEPSLEEIKRTKKKKLKKHDKDPIQDVPEAGSTELQDISRNRNYEIQEDAAIRNEDIRMTEDQNEAQSTNTEEEQFPRTEEVIDADILESANLSCFYSARMSLYLPIPAISLKTARSSILSVHIAPLLLTYYPPAKGIILAFSDPVLSAKPGTGINLPLMPPRGDDEEQSVPHDGFARSADEFGVSWTWLTANFLLFQPTRGDELKGWINVTSEGLVGLVSYNYFQTAIGKGRIPRLWHWNGPTKEQLAKKRGARKGKLRDEDNVGEIQADSVVNGKSQLKVMDHVDDVTGCFMDENGQQVSQTLDFKVVDTEMVPGSDRNTWSLQIDGTLLDDDEEAEALVEERAKFERIQRRSRSRTPGPVVSGGLGHSREGSMAY